MREVAPKLWIGNAIEARNTSAVLAAGIEAIVDLAFEEPPITATRDLVCCRIPIVDGSANPPARLRLAIDTIGHLVSSEVPTLVACSAGMSRSPAVVAASLSRLQTTPFTETLARVCASGPCDISPGLIADLAMALRETAC